MRKALLSLLLLIPSLADAQVVATFEALPLTGPDTFYVNYSNPGKDVGFDNGLMHFPCIYDTAFGGLWSTGFVYSSKRDSTTPGYTNMYSAKTAAGYNGSEKYAVFQQGFGPDNFVKEVGSTWYVPQGFYVTNSTYAYNAIRDGYFTAKKFGGATGNDPDWFKLVVYGYQGGARKSDSVAFYLADYRFANNTQDYIVKDWTWVNLQSLGPVDSLTFQLSSSDNGSFGMNTPAYFCLDQFTTQIPIVGVASVPAHFVAKVYPNPAADYLNVAVQDANIRTIRMMDMTGRTIRELPAQAQLQIPLQGLPAGRYVLQFLSADGRVANQTFVKQ